MLSVYAKLSLTKQIYAIMPPDRQSKAFVPLSVDNTDGICFKLFVFLCFFCCFQLFISVETDKSISEEKKTASFSLFFPFNLQFLLRNCKDMFRLMSTVFILRNTISHWFFPTESLLRVRFDTIVALRSEAFSSPNANQWCFPLLLNVICWYSPKRITHCKDHSHQMVRY